jgi:hypothetical protein
MTTLRGDEQGASFVEDARRLLAALIAADEGTPAGGAPALEDVVTRIGYPLPALLKLANLSGPWDPSAYLPPPTEGVEVQATAPVRTLKQQAKVLLQRYVSFQMGGGQYVAPELTSARSAVPPVELSDLPNIVDADEAARFTTHLPVYSLRAVAASMPDGGWGPRALDEVPDLLGWVRVELASHTDRRSLFLARIAGHSMEGGRVPLADGRYALFTIAGGGLDGEPVVLVRGAFRDPETGAYAVKRLHREADGAGVRLVSQNPDRARYPDIVLDPSRAHEVRVVARLVAPLDALPFDRAPRSAVRTGERDLHSRQGVAALLAALEARLDALFRGADAAPTEAAAAPWSAWLALADDGLRVALAPLEGLPAEVRYVEVAGADDRLRAPNARVHRTSLRVGPSTEPYVVRAERVDGTTEALAGVHVAGLSAEVATVFVPGAGELWRRVTTQALPNGRRVRLVIRPSLATQREVRASPLPRGDGWRVVELTVPDDPSAELRATLAELGLSIAAGALTLRAAGTLPRRVEETPRGEDLPVWRVGDVVTLDLRASAPQGEGSARVFVLGPAGLRVIDLPAGDVWSLRLTELTAGRYLARAAAVSTEVALDDLAFEVRDAVRGRWPDARASLDDEGAELLSAAEPVPRDLAAWCGEWPLRLSAPPYWPLWGQWSALTGARLPALQADEDGAVDWSPWATTLAPVVAHCRSGSLEIDLGELGQATVVHTSAPTPAAVREALRTLWAEVEAMVRDPIEGAVGAYDAWFVPALRLLGWIAPPSPDGSLAVSGMACARLLRADAQGPSLLAVAQAKRFDAEDARAAVGALVHRAGVEGAIFTDGVRWRSYEARRRRWRKTVALDESLASDDAFELFFQDFDAG